MMEYKGYTGKITTIDDKQAILHGEVVGINDVVTFQGKSVPALIKAFQGSVDDYLAFCEDEKDEPEKPFSGKFLLRIPPELHQKASLSAKKAGESLNTWVASAIRSYLEAPGVSHLKSAWMGTGNVDEEALRTVSLLSQLEGRAIPGWSSPPMLPWRPSGRFSEAEDLRSEVYRAILARLQGREAAQKHAESPPPSQSED